MNESDGGAIEPPLYVHWAESMRSMNEEEGTFPGVISTSSIHTYSHPLGPPLGQNGAAVPCSEVDVSLFLLEADCAAGKAKSQKGVLLIDAGSVVTLNQLWKIPHVILVQWVNKLKGQKELSLGVEPGRLCPDAGRC
ncbi:hypothetical protein D4764_21G0003800 [Takifugu flavidus]|uniref:Uncharacterized protein n=1 Tax=Takifugu flavidus TaxID=433684 RepID=A0A5C6NHI1_9TELE|nr:hypothetical protein D4764_21G0003800 [Takifugu flavidus]